tara:strand:- start:2164 stop:2370 length:207 start_codon:yes stop_codon:yes gene_type:complete
MPALEYSHISLLDLMLSQGSGILSMTVLSRSTIAPIMGWHRPETIAQRRIRGYPEKSCSPLFSGKVLA